MLAYPQWRILQSQVPLNVGFPVPPMAGFIRLIAGEQMPSFWALANEMIVQSHGEESFLATCAAYSQR
jgi:hypothetical protein